MLFCGFSSLLGFAAERSSIVCVSLDVDNFQRFPSSTLCSDGFVARYWLNLVLSWNSVLFCPSMLIESFAEYSSLG